MTEVSVVGVLGLWARGLFDDGEDRSVMEAETSDPRKDWMAREEFYSTDIMRHHPPRNGKR